MADVPKFELKVGQEVELTYQLDFKSAEVKRLPDAAFFSSVKTFIQEETGQLTPASAARCFSKPSDTVKITQDDQVIKLVSRVTDTNIDRKAPFDVFALYTDGTNPAPGEAPTLIANLVVRGRD
ncbi:MAG: hypothetical protein ABI647_06660 [Gemmatimonadota bacterium]